MAEKKKWIQGAIKHKGALKKSLHVKLGEKIPVKKLEKAEHSKNPTMKKRAILAETLSHMHHKGSKHMIHHHIHHDGKGMEHMLHKGKHIADEKGGMHILKTSGKGSPRKK